MTKKLFIIPWFGPYPDWLDQWVANMEVLKKYGYDYLIFSNLKLFHQRIYKKLGIFPDVKPETGMAWDFRPMLGVLYEEEIRGYDYWGHTDFDCVYGDVEKWTPDGDWEIWSNHNTYICGPWTLYKNIEKINKLYLECPGWKELSKPKNGQPTSWVEQEFSDVVRLKANYIYTKYQQKDSRDFSGLEYKDGRLLDGGDEIMMAHFRHRKTYPLDRYLI